MLCSVMLRYDMCACVCVCVGLCLRLCMVCALSLLSFCFVLCWFGAGVVL